MLDWRNDKDIIVKKTKEGKINIKDVRDFNDFVIDFYFDFLIENQKMEELNFLICSGDFPLDILFKLDKELMIKYIDNNDINKEKLGIIIFSTKIDDIEEIINFLVDKKCDTKYISKLIIKYRPGKIVNMFFGKGWFHIDMKYSDFIFEKCDENNLCKFADNIYIPKPKNIRKRFLDISIEKGYFILFSKLIVEKKISYNKYTYLIDKIMNVKRYDFICIMLKEYNEYTLKLKYLDIIMKNCDQKTLFDIIGNLKFFIVENKDLIYRYLIIIMRNGKEYEEKEDFLKHMLFFYLEMVKNIKEILHIIAVAQELKYLDFEYYIFENISLKGTFFGKKILQNITSGEPIRAAEVLKNLLINRNNIEINSEIFNLVMFLDNITLKMYVRNINDLIYEKKKYPLMYAYNNFLEIIEKFDFYVKDKIDILCNKINPNILSEISTNIIFKIYEMQDVDPHRNIPVREYFINLFKERNIMVKSSLIYKIVKKEDYKYFIDKCYIPPDRVDIILDFIIEKDIASLNTVLKNNNINSYNNEIILKRCMDNYDSNILLLLKNNNININSGSLLYFYNNYKDNKEMFIQLIS